MHPVCNNRPNARTFVPTHTGTMEHATRGCVSVGCGAHASRIRPRWPARFPDGPSVREAPVTGRVPAHTGLAVISRAATGRRAMVIRLKNGLAAAFPGAPTSLGPDRRPWDEQVVGIDVGIKNVTGMPVIVAIPSAPLLSGHLAPSASLSSPAFTADCSLSPSRHHHRRAASLYCCTSVSAPVRFSPITVGRGIQGAAAARGRQCAAHSGTRGRRSGQVYRPRVLPSGSVSFLSHRRQAGQRHPERATRPRITKASNWQKTGQGIWGPDREGPHTAGPRRAPRFSVRP